ncbi:threonine/serine exporter family protein [Pseudoluteimonas lycopersici]|uniref:Threonine/serine exporter family protein n=1 Tax=Pseudoluteimonas lycopersici TaxID=1324796 RepID=A0A516V7F9_9GAMM|nr:threonine/serine exporter family protein [Lysobacter lycopersici]QDQ74443.1 threonine/serine exporter family protein [Lysobacter lycopersici]
MQTSAAHADYAARIAFVAELAERLHTYGTTAQRLEGAIDAVAQKLGLECEPWSNPTGIILSFSDPARPAGESDTTRLIRLAPGDNDLSKLCKADHIAEEVMAGRMDVASGHAALRRLDYPPRARARAMQVLGFGLAAAGMAGLLRLPWLDIATAGVTGLLIGLLNLVSGVRPQLREAEDAVAGLIAGAVAVLVAAYAGPLNLNTVIIVSLIVLLPGMSLTNAVNELTSQHLVSGTARFAGALATVMKLAVGTMIALTVANMLGVQPQVRALRPQPEWLGWAALLVVAYALAVLFRAQRRDVPLVMASVVVAYALSKFASDAWSGEVGIFLSALAMTAAGNGYARWAKRPGAMVRLPGIIVLVPGSASLRGMLDLVQQQDVGVGQAATLGVINILLALVAGLLFGNLLLPTRRNL